MTNLYVVLVTNVNTQQRISDERYNNLFEKVVSLDNLYLAEKKLERIKRIDQKLFNLIK